MSTAVVPARPRTGLLVRAAAVLACAVVPVALAFPTPATAVPTAVPVAPTFATGIDAPADYQGQATCSPTPKPGASRLAALLKTTYGRYSVGISRPCSDGGQSEHKEGRALDWMVSYKVAAQRARAQAFLGWLLAPDTAGNPAAMARRMGVMYIGWNNHMWRGYDIARGWADLKGCSTDPAKRSSSYDTYCHRNHVHISLSWDGAQALTSFWDGTPVAGSCDTPWDSAPAQAPASLSMVPVPSARVLDTRTGLGTGGTPCRLVAPRWSGDSPSVSVPVTGVGDVPASGVAAVTLRLYSGTPNQATSLRAFTTGDAAPTAMNSLVAGLRATVTSTVVLPVASDGTVRIATTSGGADVVADVVAYAPVDPTPIAVVGAGLGNGHPQVLSTAAAGTLAAGESRIVSLAGHGGVPGVAISGLHAVVTAWSTDTSAVGSLRVGSVAVDGSTLLPASFTVPVAGLTPRTRTVVVSTTDGRVAVASSSASTVRYRVDVAAWYGPAEDVSGFRTVLTRPVPVVNTTWATGVAGPLVSGRSVTVTPKPGAVPASAVAVLLQVTVRGTANGSLVLSPTGQVAQGRSMEVRGTSPVTDLVLVPLSVAHTFDLRCDGAGASVVAYAVGYLR